MHSRANEVMRQVEACSLACFRFEDAIGRSLGDEYDMSTPVIDRYLKVVQAWHVWRGFLLELLGEGKA